MDNKEATIKQAQAELAELKARINAELTAYEQKFNVEIGYTIFVDHCKDGAVSTRITANI